jgi:hypothetical protein
MLTTQVYLVLRLRMNGTIPLLPYTLSWHGQANLYINFFTYVCGPVGHEKMQCGKLTLVFQKNLLLSSSSYERH